MFAGYVDAWLPRRMTFVCLQPSRSAPDFREPGQSHESPRWPQIGPKRFRYGPNMAPRWPQEAPRWPQDGHRRRQDGAKRPQNGPNRPQDAPRRRQEAPRSPQEHPRWHQDRPKMAPMWPQDGPKVAPGWPQDGPKMAPSAEDLQKHKNIKICTPSRRHARFQGPASAHLTTMTRKSSSRSNFGESNGVSVAL